MRQRIHYTKPSITELEVEYATDATRNGWGEKCYEYIEKFEDSFKEHLNVKYAIATSSCTGALHLGLSALGVGLGDEVILADTNWIASVSPITYLGASPVFVDILPDTWCIDPKEIEKNITSKTKAIIAVHLYGNLCDMDALLEISQKYNVPVIEDAAEAIGSIYHGKRAGSMGKFGCFSFHGTKTLTTGEGGLFVTNDESLYEKVLTLSNHGRDKNQTRQFWPDMIGYKYKMSNIQAAIGCAQLNRIDELINEKRRIFDAYYHEISEYPLAMNPEYDGTVNGYWMPTVIIAEAVGIETDKLLSEFHKREMDCRVFFYPLSMLSMFKEKKSNKNSYSLYKRGINLPSYHDLTQDQIYSVTQVVKNYFKNMSLT